MKISIGDAPLPEDVEHYNQTGLRNFETDLEELSGGRIDVQIFWNGQLGKVENVLNLVRNGQVEGVIASDGHVAPYYPDIQVLGLPYLFIDRQVAYDVFDGEFGTYLADKMADESGIRPMPWLENGGVSPLFLQLADGDGRGHGGTENPHNEQPAAHADRGIARWIANPDPVG